MRTNRFVNLKGENRNARIKQRISLGRVQFYCPDQTVITLTSVRANCSERRVAELKRAVEEEG